MIKTKADRILIAAVSIFLALLMTLLLPVQRIAAAEEKQTLYVSEVRLGYGKTAEEAAKSLEGYTILKNGDKYADLNEGSGKSTVVLLGYKTTTEKGKAITDIAAMNMKGGYSFTEYKMLMDQYRDSQITPFLNRFMSTVQEYRDNYNGENKNNKAKAEYVHNMLNLFTDDDTGMAMGDLLLKQTAEEYGPDKYEKLTNDEKKKYGSLTTILMQGETSTVFMIEQLVTMAADTNDTTWLQRLENVTADSLLKEYMKDGAGETDAKAAMAREYEDTARLFAEKWNYFRNSLIEYEDSLKAEDGGVEFDPENLPTAEEEEEDAETESSAEDALDSMTGEDVMNAVLEYTEIEKRTAEDVDKTKIAASYNNLKSIKYGSGTMYDYFTQTDEDIKKDNYFALYPLVSVLTKGQIAGADFMNLNQLVQYGIAIESSYEEMTKDVGEYIKETNSVSVYEGVNRELYEEGTALTDAEMREQAADSTQLFGDTQSAAIGRASVFAAVGIASALGAVYSISKVKQALTTTTAMINLTEQELETVSRLKTAISNHNAYLAYADNPTLSNFYSKNFIHTVTYDVGAGGNDVIVLKIGHPNASLASNSGAIRIKRFEMPKSFQSSNQIAAEGTTQQNLDDISEKISSGAKGAGSVGRSWGAVLKAGVGTLFSLAFLGLSVYSIYSSVMELYDYYHVDMTKVPKYIVDRADLTDTDENGNTVIRRNESAYYEAVISNRAKDHKYYETMKEYGDVNAGEGRQWLVLYTNSDLSVKTPILADSFTVVTGKADIPDGYSTGIHMFGEETAVNMTNTKYTYDDKLKGIYVYFKYEPAATTSTGTAADAKTDSGDEAPATSSAFGIGFTALAGFCGLVIGVACGVLIMYFLKRREQSENA